MQVFLLVMIQSILYMDLYILPDDKAILTHIKKTKLYSRNIQTITNLKLKRIRKIMTYPTTCYCTVFHIIEPHR